MDLEWLNSNHGLISAAATVVIAFFAIITTFLTLTLANENRLMRKSGTEPKVVAYLKLAPYRAYVVNFVLANVGQGPARDVEFTFQADESDFRDHDVRIGNYSDRTLTSMLPQGERIETLFGFGHLLMKDPKLRPFKVSVTFQDLNGKNDNKEFVLDVAQFTGFRTRVRPPEYEIAQTLKEIETVIGQLVKQGQQAGDNEQ